jgi:hypothetical protein
VSQEVELLRRYLDATVDPDPDLSRIRIDLTAAIDVDSFAPEYTQDRIERRTPRAKVVVLLTALVAAALIVALLLSALPSQRAAVRTAAPPVMPLGAKAQLRLIADRITGKPVPRLSNGQLLFTRAKLSVDATVNNGAAEASIALSVQKWSTPTGQTCTALTAQPATFASPAEQAAWTGLGLRTLPQPATAEQCLQGGAGNPPDAITGAGQLIDVSKLPINPSALAQELEADTTGIPALDELRPDLAAPNLAFQRAAMLLIGPTVGASTQFDASLYQAIALLPGVVALGPTIAHDGQGGQGFASGPGGGQTTIVVNPSSGRLLEVSGLDDSTTFTSIAENYLAGGPMRIDEYSADLQWLDPRGVPTVVSQSDLPSDLPTYVFATAKPGVTVTQLQPLLSSLDRTFATTLTSWSEQSADPADAASPVSWDWSLNVPPSGATSFINALKKSGLFAAVVEL